MMHAWECQRRRKWEDAVRQIVKAGLLLLAAVFTACGVSDERQLEANKNLVREFAARIDAGDWEALDELVTKDIRRHSRATTARPEISSREEFKQHEQARNTPWPDGRVTYEMMLAEGNMVAAYATFTGTNNGPLGQFSATGRPVETKFLAMFRIEEGKIAEIWVEWDNIAVLSQLGLYPPTGSEDGN